MEKTPIAIALLTMMMVKSTNARIDPLCRDTQQAQSMGSVYDKGKFRKENNTDVKHRADADTDAKND